jgi:hypothetical protein
MKIKQYFSGLKNPYKQPCNPQPGHWNSCEPCKTCGRKAKFPQGEPGPAPFGSELREDGSNELREDGGIELREN